MSGVGVVVATRDRRESLLATLARLEALPERPPIAVVDNDSSDGSAEAVARAHPEVRVLRLRRNAGSAARTEGARLLDTALVAFCDDDSWWAPGALARAERLFARHPRLALAAARILVEPGARLDPTCTAMLHSPLAPDAELPGPPVLGFVACGTIVRREPFLAAGGFHPRLGIGGEERLLALDLAAAGWGLAYVDGLVAHHCPGQVPDARPGRLARELRNELWTAWLRRPPAAAARRSAALLAGPRRAGELRGVVDALLGLPWVLRERRAVPRALECQIRLLERAPAPAG